MKSTVKKSDLIIVFCLVLVFGAMIYMNNRLVSTTMLYQIEQVSQNRLEIVRSDYENISIEVEQAMLNIINGVEKIYYSGGSREDLETMLTATNAQLKAESAGVILRVYAVNPDWVILPGEEFPEGYHPTEQEWYRGAVESPETLYFADPYYDVLTGIMCFTLTMSMDDGKTVIGMDMKLDGIEEYVQRMAGEDKSPALIVTDEGLLIGYTEMELAGKKVADVLPEYSQVLEKITQSKEKTNRFKVDINGDMVNVFYSTMRNGWYMALIMNDDALYGDANTLRTVNILVNGLLLILIITTFIAGSRNRIRAQEALQSREEFVTRVLDNLHEPLGKIIRLSDMERFNNSNDIKADMADIKAAGLRLKEMMDNLRSYSTIVMERAAGRAGRKKQKRELAQRIKIFRNVIIVILVVVSGISMFFYVHNRRSVVRENILSDMDEYNTDLTLWALEQSTVLQMYTDIICSQPEIVNNYDSAVNWLNKMSQNYQSYSLCFVANADAEHSIIANNGWVPNEDFKLEEREWYQQAIAVYPAQFASAPYIEASKGYYCITLSQAMYDEQHNFLGVFGIDIYLDKLIGIFEDEEKEEKYVFLVDTYGSIINHPNVSYQKSDTNDVKVTDTPYAGIYLAAGSDTSNIQNITDYTGERCIAVCKTNTDLGFSLIMVENWWASYKEILVYCIIYLIFIVIGILTVIILLNRVIRSQADMNRELTATADRAMAAGRAKSDFLAQMSHEIRTPINAVIGMDEMILRENRDPEIREYAENIKSASQTLLTLINGILDFSKIESGKMEILKVRYETLDMIDNLVNLVSDRTEKKGLNLILDIDPTLPRTMLGDDVRIRQVVTNLLTNAVKYTREGDITLSIRGEKGKTEDDYILKVAVKDTGIGIKAEDMEKLFQSFQRLEEERNRNIEGTGLGMSIVQGLLSMMGSKLEVESEYGIGSTFSFSLDQQVLDGTGIGEYSIGRAKEEEKKTVRRTVTLKDADILVVDDNDMNLKVAKGLLKRYGVVPELCASGRKSLNLIKAKRYDIILMDHMMPGMDGVEVLKEIRAENLTPEDVPIIALTANAILGAREEYLSYGFKDYLSKPIDVQQLEEMLIKYLPEEKVQIKEEEESETGKSGEEKTSDQSSDRTSDNGNDTPSGSGSGESGEAAGADVSASEVNPNENKSETGDVSGAGEDGGGAAAGGSTVTQSSFTDRLAMAGFNIESAHSYTMDDDEFYMELLETFVSGESEKAESIRKFYEEEDWKNYQITVHGLKSAARTIGDDTLADLALAQEMAAKEGRIEDIRAGVDELISTYHESAIIVEGAIKD